MAQKPECISTILIFVLALGLWLRLGVFDTNVGLGIGEDTTGNYRGLAIRETAKESLPPQNRILSK